jgi:glycosyltransferase involved in cell wall biosynthesis
MTPTISYAITAYNEHAELERLLTQLEAHVSKDDEIIVQLDTSATTEVRTVLEKFKSVIVTEFPLNKDFATFKNNIKKFATKDYIIYIDADEYPNNDLISYLPTILEMNPEVDLYYVPRWNTVEGLTKGHIQKWGWNVDPYGRVNWPDLQSRIVKNKPELVWSGKVHERIQGHKTVSRLPEQFYLQHPKTIERQEKQNKLYETI